MNLLLLAYGDYYSNGSIHVFNFANWLVELGHDCCVAVPDNKESVSNIGNPKFNNFNFAEILNGSQRFKNGLGPDIVHCWTPREIVRRMVESLHSRSKFKLVIHLEDDEEMVTASMTGRTVEGLRLASSKSLTDLPIALTNPTQFKAFLGSADGITIITDQLKDYVPDGTRCHLLWPGVDIQKFTISETLDRSTMGIAESENVVVYTGGVHPLIANEVRSLYLAIGLLNKRGCPTRLVRTGKNMCEFLLESDSWVRQFVTELGVIRWSEIPKVVAFADVLIQPGKATPFNSMRLPSKLPEFFAAAKPVLLPITNVGHLVRDGVDAVLTYGGSAEELCGCLQVLFRHESLRQTLGVNGRNFAKRYFDWATNTKGLAKFYETVLSDAEPNAPCRLAPLINTEGVPVESDFANHIFQVSELFQARTIAVQNEVLKNEENERLRLQIRESANDFQNRIKSARSTRSWRLMRFARRFDHMVFHGENGGITGFLKWLWGTKDSSNTDVPNYDPFLGAKIDSLESRIGD